jgi:hypothetical protein
MDERVLKWLFDDKMAIDEWLFYRSRKDFKYRTNLMLKEQLKEIWDYGETINQLLPR